MRAISSTLRAGLAAWRKAVSYSTSSDQPRQFLRARRPCQCLVPANCSRQRRRQARRSQCGCRPRRPSGCRAGREKSSSRAAGASFSVCLGDSGRAGNPASAASNRWCSRASAALVAGASPGIVSLLSASSSAAGQPGQLLGAERGGDRFQRVRRGAAPSPGRRPAARHRSAGRCRRNPWRKACSGLQGRRRCAAGAGPAPGRCRCRVWPGSAGSGPPVSRGASDVARGRQPAGDRLVQHGGDDRLGEVGVDAGGARLFRCPRASRGRSSPAPAGRAGGGSSANPAGSPVRPSITGIWMSIRTSR